MRIKKVSETEKQEVELIRRAIDGDREAFAVLITENYDLIFKLAWKFVLNREDAEDIAQNVAMKLAKSLQTYRFEAKFSSWLYRLVVNAAKDYLKSKNRKTGQELPLLEEVLSDEASNNAEINIEAKELIKEINKLPIEQKEAVILVYWEGYSHKQAAEILNCAETTISWRLYEARRRLGKFAKGDAK